MIKIRPSNERGHLNYGWLDTYHTFSFSEYHDPDWMAFRTLRVINEDCVQPGEGFGTHAHRDMEIITYVLQGALEHKDSMGNGSIIRPGDVQRMSAGTGVTHSEFNPSKSELVHLLQIWIFPEKKGLKPEYEQKRFEESQKKGRLCLIASRDGREGSVTIHQDASLYAAVLKNGQKLEHSIDKNRHAWIQVARGSISLNGQLLNQGDGAAVSEEKRLEMIGKDDADLLLFDLA